MTKIEISSSRRGRSSGNLSALQKVQRAASKKAILQAIRECLCKKSFEAVTIEDILIFASISRATFYRHFKSKSDVASALYEQAFTRAFPHFRRLADVSTLDTAVAWINEMADYYRQEAQASVLILHLGVTNPGFHQRQQRDRHGLIEHLGESLPAFKRAIGTSSAARLQHARADLMLMRIDRICVEIVVHESLPDHDFYIQLGAQELIDFLIGSAPSAALENY